MTGAIDISVDNQYNKQCVEEETMLTIQLLSHCRIAWTGYCDMIRKKESTVPRRRNRACPVSVDA
ncbi:hypothetical protein J2851_006961 [Azospirillum rugosum]|uniref:Uncharacterized protein n=1 Tax=Azospirillum rugosum TaxID=416170 RepID=A0ABS4SYT3_9PROT|nr:hypothetical protein [Azospirillum rugosum]MDQ0530952.1 hypothetical protein [Azospirillum rugosum]